MPFAAHSATLPRTRSTGKPPPSGPRSLSAIDPAFGDVPEVSADQVTQVHLGAPAGPGLLPRSSPCGPSRNPVLDCCRLRYPG